MSAELWVMAVFLVLAVAAAILSLARIDVSVWNRSRDAERRGITILERRLASACAYCAAQAAVMDGPEDLNDAIARLEIQRANLAANRGAHIESSAHEDVMLGDKSIASVDYALRVLRRQQFKDAEQA